MGFTDESLTTYGVVPKKKRVRRQKKTTTGQTAQPDSTGTTTPASPTPQAQPPAVPAAK